MAMKKGLVFTFAESTKFLTANGFSISGITAFEAEDKVFAQILVELRGAKLIEIDTELPDQLKKDEMFIAFEDTSTFKVGLDFANHDLNFTYVKTTGERPENTIIQVTGADMGMGFAFTKVGPQSGE